MSTTRILVDPTKALAKQALEYIDAVNDAQAKGRRLKLQIDASQSGADYVSLAAELGLPAPLPPQQLAQDAWAILSNAVAALNAPAVLELARLDQG